MKEIKEIRREIVPDPEPELSWLDQKDSEMGDGFEKHAADRKAAYERDEWSMVGVRAVAEIVVNGTSETITSAGLWNIEDDSGADYITFTFADELTALCDMLKELGFSEREINEAIVAEGTCTGSVTQEGWLSHDSHDSCPIHERGD